MNARRSIPILLLGSDVPAAPPSRPAARTPAAPDGKQLFLTNKCNTCHTIKAAGIEKKKSEDCRGGEGEIRQEAAGSLERGPRAQGRLDRQVPDEDRDHQG
jgi:mono/diheme cytochrome c family protein